MTNTNGGNRLDRIEAALLRFIEESDKRINSNAKALEALVNQQAENEQRATRDRQRLYETMSRLAAAQADFYTAQAGFYSAQTEMYRRLDTQDELLQTLSRRQGEIVGVLRALTNRGQQNGGQPE